MNRRNYLRVIPIVGTVGCLGTAREATEDDTEQMFEISFTSGTDEDVVVSSEHVAVRNVSNSDQQVTGYTLAYSSGHEYTVREGLLLEPGAKVAIVTQGRQNVVAESDPPTYYRGADLSGSVLADGSETVQWIDPDGNTVASATFDA